MDLIRAVQRKCRYYHLRSIGAAVVAQRKSTLPITESLWVQFLPGAGLFSSSILSNMSLKQLHRGEVALLCFLSEIYA